MASDPITGHWLPERKIMVSERKSKYKYKITVPASRDTNNREMRDWCTQTFGPGGRHKALRWRFGWTGVDDTFYFKNGKDVSMFLLRWS
jgi:hypothetical protein